MAGTEPATGPAEACDRRAREASRHLIGFPARDEMDEILLQMLRRLVDLRRYDLRILSSGLLPIEMLSAVENESPALACIAALPAGGLAPARYMIRRLRRRFPALPILAIRISAKGAAEGDRNILLASGADRIAFGLTEARAAIEELSMRFETAVDPGAAR